MNKLLIINLKRFGDIFQTGHLIQTLRESKPGTEIHLLCYQESTRAAKVLKGISKIHTIDRQKITSFYKNSIYSDGLAFNEMERTLNSVIEEGFNEVVNYSSDKVSTFLSSYLEGTGSRVHGISFTSRQTLKYSNNYSLVLNDVLTQVSFTPLSHNDCYHQIMGELYRETTAHKDAVKTSKIHNETARNNLNRLRSMKSEDTSGVSIIGIQLLASSPEKSIPTEVLIELIRKINKNSNMYPILLIAPTDQERNAANTINQEFSNRLVSVEADFIALPSVLKNIDLLLTPDTSVKHMADLLDTPTLEISLGPAPFLKQGTINTKSGIISSIATTRVFRENTEAPEVSIESNRNLDLEFTFECMKDLLGLDANPTSQTHSFYRPRKVVDGIYFSPQKGSFNESFEIKRALARATIQKVTTGVIDENLIEYLLSSFNRREALKTIEEEKAGVGLVTKDLLSTLRGLIQTQENKSKAPMFIESLERLLTRCFDNYVASVPTLVFRARVESLNSSSMEENFKEVESLLYKLKDDLQSCIYVFKRFEDISYGIKKAPLQSESITTNRSENTL